MKASVVDPDPGRGDWGEDRQVITGSLILCCWPRIIRMDYILGEMNEKG